MNKNTRIITPTTLIEFKTGSGHLVHSKLDKGWYFVPSTIVHSVHNNPE